MHLVDQIKEKARKNLQTVVLPESYDERMLFAAEKIVKEGLARIVILGDPAKIQADASAKGINLAGVELLNPAASPKLDSATTIRSSLVPNRRCFKSRAK